MACEPQHYVEALMTPHGKSVKKFPEFGYEKDRQTMKE
jgi:hypothetical protein